MSSFAFGMILIAAGFVAYAINHALKPHGWAPADRKPNQRPSYTLTRMAG